MSALTKTTAKNRSGCVGVSLARRKRILRDGTVVIRRWWTAQCGERIRRFSIDALGNRAAYHEAVRARAQWVRRQAPKELARKKAKKTRNFRTYVKRYAQKERRRQKAYYAANKAKINALRRHSYPFKARGRHLAYQAAHRPQINARRRQLNREKKGGA